MFAHAMSTNDGEIETFVTPLCFITLQAAIFGAYDVNLSNVFCYEFEGEGGGLNKKALQYDAYRPHCNKAEQ